MSSEADGGANETGHASQNCRNETRKSQRLAKMGRTGLKEVDLEFVIRRCHVGDETGPEDTWTLPRLRASDCHDSYER